jgi:hypothetical protein
MASWRWGCRFSTELDGPFLVFEKQSRERSDEFDGEACMDGSEMERRTERKGNGEKKYREWIRFKCSRMNACGKVSQKRNCLYQRD